MFWLLWGPSHRENSVLDIPVVDKIFQTFDWLAALHQSIRTHFRTFCSVGHVLTCISRSFDIKLSSSAACAISSDNADYEFTSECFAVCHLLMNLNSFLLIRRQFQKWLTRFSEISQHFARRNTVWCRYNAVTFLQNPHNRHPIARGKLDRVIRQSTLL